MHHLSLLTYALLAASFTGCAAQRSASSTQGTTVVRTAYVTGVRDITHSGEQAAGIGSVVGAVLGGLAGNHIGGGSGRSVATIGGAFAGNIAGHRAENAMATKTVTELTVRFDNDQIRTYQVEPGASFRMGDSVKVTTSRGMTTVTR